MTMIFLLPRVAQFIFGQLLILETFFSHAIIFYFHGFFLLVLVLPSGTAFTHIKPATFGLTEQSVIHWGYKKGVHRDITDCLCTQYCYFTSLPNRTQIISGSNVSTEVSAEVFPIPIYRWAWLLRGSYSCPRMSVLWFGQWSVKQNNVSKMVLRYKQKRCGQGKRGEWEIDEG